jgi:uncharacterized protein YjbJ (UPF0337 family)
MHRYFAGRVNQRSIMNNENGNTQTAKPAAGTPQVQRPESVGITPIPPKSEPSIAPPKPQQAANDSSQYGTHKQQEQQQQSSLPSVDEVKGKWKQHMGAAKIAWGKLTEDDLLKSEGHAQKLAGIVQERYAISRDEADKQVKSFLAKHDS